jgi:hypothetical protein
MLVDWQFFSNFYLHWFFSNLSFFEQDPHMDSLEAIRVKNLSSVHLSTVIVPEIE